MSSIEGKRLLVLGAGLFQMAGITRAVELGCEVVTADNVPDNPGHRLGHRQLHVSTTDVSGVLAAAEALDIDGIVTFASDVATPAVAATMQRRFERGPSPAAVATTTDKARFRDFQQRAGLPSPRHLLVDDPDRSVDTGELSWPVIVKPVDSSGSRGVSTATEPDEVPGTVARALAASRTGFAVVEEFVPGREVGGDLFLVGGTVVSGIVTNKYLRDFVVIGHSVPSTLAPSEERGVIDAVARTCRAIGILDGPVNFDVIVDAAGDRDPIVLELSPRTGGNGIPELVRSSTGFDEYEATIRHALGAPVTTRDQGHRRSCGSAVFGAGSAGVLSHLEIPSSLGRPERSVVAAWLRHRPGDLVNSFTEAGASIGYLVFECDSDADYRSTVSALERSIDVRVRQLPADPHHTRGVDSVDVEP